MRLLQSLIRLSQAHARLMYRELVIVEDAINAIIIMESSMQVSKRDGGLKPFLHDFIPRCNRTLPSWSNQIASMWYTPMDIKIKIHSWPRDERILPIGLNGHRGMTLRSFNVLIDIQCGTSHNWTRLWSYLSSSRFLCRVLLYWEGLMRCTQLSRRMLMRNTLHRVTWYYRHSALPKFARRSLNCSPNEKNRLLLCS